MLIFELHETACGLRNSGAVDAAIVAGPLSIDEELCRIRLWSEERVVPLPPGHALADRSALTLADVDAVGWIDVIVDDDVWKRHWRLDDIRGGPPHEIGPPQASGVGVADAVFSGRALIVTIQSFARVFEWTPLVYVPVVDAPPVRVDLAWRHDHAPGRLADLAEAIRSERVAVTG